MAGATQAFAQDGKRLSRTEALAAVVTRVQPDYPAMARQLKVEGSVEVEAAVAENGQVEAVKIVSGNPLLTKPAVDAVKKWKFAPQTDGGKPSRAIAPIVMNFKL